MGAAATVGRTQLDAFVVGVEQEGAETVGHVVVGQELQVVLAELELHGELQVDLRRRDKHASRMIFTSQGLINVKPVGFT